MLRTSKSFVLGGVCLAVVVCVTSFVVLITRASSNSSPASQTAAVRPVNKGRRNLSLQPEASRVARQLGNRFGPASRAVTASSGQLSVGETQKAMSLIRRQTDSGETTELNLADRALTWNADEGTKINGGAPTENDRLMVERLILDSPDNFVLAQVRGASYFTVARNVRPGEVSDGYTSPLWNLVEYAFLWCGRKSSCRRQYQRRFREWLRHSYEQRCERVVAC